MPAKKGTKRQVEAATPVAKKSRADATFEGVAEAIQQAVDIPEVVRMMLLAGLPDGLGTPSDERHELQTGIVSMIGQVVLGVQAKLQDGVDAEATKVGGADGRRAELAALLAKAEAGLDAAAQDAQAQAAAHAAAEAAAEAAAAKLAESQEAQRAGDAALEQAQQSKARLEMGLNVHLRGIVEADQCEQHHQALLPLLQELALDQSLMSALPSVCAKQPSERGAFDAMVLEQLGKILGEKVAELAKFVDEAAPAAQQRAAAVAEAQVGAEAATASRASAAAALEASTLAEQAAKDAGQSAAAALAAFEPEYMAATQARDEKQATLVYFKAYNVGSFELLRDKTSDRGPDRWCLRL